MRELMKLTDKDVIVHAIVRLGFGANPIENWGRLFDPAFGAAVHDQVLANRAFSIWFPTSLDFISAQSAMRDLQAEAQNRKLDIDRIASLHFSLCDLLKRVAASLTRDEQIFLRDRRLQNVHGNLEYFLAETPSIKWFDPAKDEIVVEKLTEAELHYGILRPFNLDHGLSQYQIRTRVVGSPPWRAVRRFWRKNLTMAALRDLTIVYGVAPDLMPMQGSVA